MSVYIILSDSPLIPSVKLFAIIKWEHFLICVYTFHTLDWKKLMRQIRKTFSNHIPCFLSSAILTSQKKYFCNTLNKVNYIFQFRTHLDYVYTYVHVDNNVWGLNEWNIKSLFSVTNNYNRFAAFQANLNPMYSKLCCKTECRDKLLLTKS